MCPDSVRAVWLSVASVSAKTRWMFLEVETESGLRGSGEATLPGRETAVTEATERWAHALLAFRDLAAARLLRPMLRELPEAAAFSALDQALWDIEAQRRGVWLADALGTACRDRVPVYANLNRRTVDRSPSGFAAGARDAIAAGHDWFKIAPFDEATPAARGSGLLETAVEPGLRRIAAVRDAIGPDRRLMVDCHWRLDEAVAERVIAASAELGVHWIECPLPETVDVIEAIARLRGVANRLGVKLAGMEAGVGVDGFLPFLRAGAYDVIMPDVKYVGGLDEFIRLAETAAGSGVLVSPHNPSGPISHAVSLQLSLVLPGFDRLEMQFDESPLFSSLIHTAFPSIAHGCAAVPPGPGHGAVLDPVALAACTTHRIVFRSEGQANTVAETAV